MAWLVVALRDGSAATISQGREELNGGRAVYLFRNHCDQAEVRRLWQNERLLAALVTGIQMMRTSFVALPHIQLGAIRSEACKPRPTWSTLASSIRQRLFGPAQPTPWNAWNWAWPSPFGRSYRDPWFPTWRGECNGAFSVRTEEIGNQPKTARAEWQSAKRGRLALSFSLCLLCSEWNDLFSSRREWTECKGIR